MSRENLAIKAFGCNESEEKIRDVVEFSLSSLRGGKGVKMQCYVIKEITDIVDEHIEIVKKSYPHLQKVWFSDVARHQDTLSIDILIASDFFWNFQAGETIRGGPDEPVAVKTSLGWVLSGPLKGKKLSSVANVNFLPSTEKRKVEIDVDKLWNLDTLGIRPESEVQEFFVDNIVFTGDRYSVSLPWKAGHGPIPCNYTNSLMRLKSQVKKLKQVPEVFAKYGEVISEQIEMGIVSKVCSDPKHREPNLQLRPHFIIHSQTTLSISAKSSHIWTSPYVIPVITSYRSFLCFCLSHMSIPPTQPTTFFLYLFSNSCVMIRQLNLCIYVCKIILNNQSVDQCLNSTSSVSGSVFSAR